MGLPPGPHAPRPLQTAAWLLRPQPYLDRCRERYGDTFTLRIMQEGDWVITGDPAAVRDVFTGDPGVLRAGAANALLEPMLGPRSLLLRDGADHLAERKRMLPAFHGGAIARLEGVVEDAVDRAVRAWPASGPVRLLGSMHQITLEVVLRAVLGAPAPAVRDAVLAMLEWSSAPGRMAVVAAVGPRRAGAMRSFRAVLDPVHALLAAEIAARRDTPRDDVLSVLLAAGLSDDDARDEAMTLLVAGHETTATAAAWALERIVHHREAYARARAGDAAWIDAVVAETLRLRPVLAIVVRELAEPLRIAGFDLPAGARIVPCIHLVHRRPDLYPDPLAFRPERFLERPPGTYTWIPFGGGVRRCIGASFAQWELARVLRHVLARVDLAPGPHGPERVRRRMITLAPARDGEVTVVAGA